jgi:hypothetical protein
MVVKKNENLNHLLPYDYHDEMHFELLLRFLYLSFISVIFIFLYFIIK